MRACLEGMAVGAMGGHAVAVFRLGVLFMQAASAAPISAIAKNTKTNGFNFIL